MWGGWKCGWGWSWGSLRRPKGAALWKPVWVLSQTNLIYLFDFTCTFKNYKVKVEKMICPLLGIPKGVALWPPEASPLPPSAFTTLNPRTSL